MTSAAIYGCTGLTLTTEERAFFRDADPLGFILFARNCDTPDQIRALCADLRDSVGRSEAPILIDQEGGRVQRLRPPHWRSAPPAGMFAALARRDARAGVEALRLNALLIAHELKALTIDVDCWPLADVPQSDADPIIGDRAFGRDVSGVARLARIACDGLLAGGVLPVIKHVPGHGRARADSHKELPRVDASLQDLRSVDFEPFRQLADMPIAMTAHVVYNAVDAQRCATVSPTVITDVIRGWIGFSGFLVSDDLSMKALEGDFAARAKNALAAGCDAVLHCNGEMPEMTAVATGVRALDAAGTDRWQWARAKLTSSADFDRTAAETRLRELMTA